MSCDGSAQRRAELFPDDNEQNSIHSRAFFAGFSAYNVYSSLKLTSVAVSYSHSRITAVTSHLDLLRSNSATSFIWLARSAMTTGCRRKLLPLPIKWSTNWSCYKQLRSIERWSWRKKNVVVRMLEVTRMSILLQSDTLQVTIGNADMDVLLLRNLPPTPPPKRMKVRKPDKNQIPDIISFRSLLLWGFRFPLSLIWNTFYWIRCLWL